MQQSIFHKLSNVLWRLAVVAVVLLAVYVSLGRLFSTNLQTWQDDVLTELNSRVPFRISADRLAGEWHSFTPEIVFHGLELDLPGSDTVPLQLSGGRVGVDVLKTLGSRSLKFTSLQLDGLELSGELTADGKFVIPGLTGSGGELGQWLRDFLLNIEYITLQGNVLKLLLPSGETREYALDLHLARDGSARQLTADMLSTAGTDIHLVGRGLGDPFRPDQFEGMLYLRLDAGNLAAVGEMFATEPEAWLKGRLDSETWLSWDRGVFDLEMDVDVSDLVLRPREGDWSVPLDALSFQASLKESKNHWTLFANNLNASLGDVTAGIPRVQLDSWGDSLRVRTSSLELEPFNLLMQGLPSMPETLRSVFATLAPRGELSALQVSFGDVSQPLSEWDVEGNFDRLEVDSWKGAPGVTSGTGYFELSETGGYVVIDSQQFTMAYPTLYSQPLYYDDFYGTLNLSWDEDALLLHSGLITATAVEGTAQALFSLNIPFSQTEVGLEMDLMVGLANSHPIHRVKYIPYTLNESLLTWLAGAVGEGDVQQAGFVWRGSLKPQASDFRTVQLMLNVANTSMVYHPDWPTVTGLRGVVLLDDTDVSVWAETAKLYQSQVEHLSAEAWMGANSQMQLAIDGRVVGTAEDALRAVNESLLGQLTKGAFSDWTASGNARTHLQLELNLADKKVPPVVDVLVDFSDVDLLVNPGRLPLTQLNGLLSYTSKAGFSSQSLTTRLWGEPVALSVGQRSLRGAADTFEFTQSAVEVGFESRVHTRELQTWLQQDALALASGDADVEGLVSVVPGEVPLLTLRSTLEGVALDLPQPWSKSEDAAAALDVALPLGGEQMVLGIALGDELSLQLDITGGGLSAASLGVSASPPELLAGYVQVGGSASLVDVDGWLDFADRYLLSEAAVDEFVLDPNTLPLEPLLAEETLDSQSEAGGFRLVIDDAHADRLILWGGEYEAVDFSLDLDSDGWLVRGRTDWLQGIYRQPADEKATLVLDFLDISALADNESDTSEIEAEADDETITEAQEPFEFSPVEVVVKEVRRAGKPIGELQMSLESEGATVIARDIQGELAGLRLLPEQPAELTWRQGQDTQLQAQLHFADFGNTLDQLGYPAFLETEKGELTLQIGWPGAPQAVALASLDGALSVDVEAGRFLETPSGTGALKVVEIVNLADVLSSLSLSHMFESGINFHSLVGEVFFHSGTLEVSDVTVEGSSSAFVVSGLSDVDSQSLDGELVATLPVANNLPWVAALAAGLPVAAGVFVVSKVFEKQVNRLSSGVYSIKGTWDDPQINFDRIFDDELRLTTEAPVAPDPNEPPVDSLTALEMLDVIAPVESFDAGDAGDAGDADDADGGIAEPADTNSESGQPGP
ncbi:MAG: AsmA-like C-terminal region-containing protein [Halioglobus sp.]